MGEDFRKMGEDLAQGAEELAESVASMFEDANTTFQSSAFSWDSGEEKAAAWTGKVTTDGESFVLQIPVPGKAPGDLEVRVFANKVRVKVAGAKAAKFEKHDYELPQQIDPKLCTAVLHRGVLTLKVRKTGVENTGVKIEVTEK
jgi:HSP20 family molecular chaperone IbpA